MSTVAQAGGRARRATRSSSRVRPFAGGVAWIVLFAVLLAGVVAVNVTVLRLNVELDRTSRERSQVQADIASLRAELSSASATARIERLARNELGLVSADADDVVYVQLPR